MTRPLDELLYHMKTLARSGDSEWERNFARSVLRHSKRPTWRPTPKQERIMQEMVIEMFDQSDSDLIDRDAGDHQTHA